jgi:hypothetical protein
MHRAAESVPNVHTAHRVFHFMRGDKSSTKHDGGTIFVLFENVINNNTLALTHRKLTIPLARTDSNRNSPKL